MSNFILLFMWDTVAGVGWGCSWLGLLQLLPADTDVEQHTSLTNSWMEHLAGQAWWQKTNDLFFILFIYSNFHEENKKAVWCISYSFYFGGKMLLLQFWKVTRHLGQSIFIEFDISNWIW